MGAFGAMISKPAPSITMPSAATISTMPTNPGAQTKSRSKVRSPVTVMPQAGPGGSLGASKLRSSMASPLSLTAKSRITRRIPEPETDMDTGCMFPSPPGYPRENTVPTSITFPDALNAVASSGCPTMLSKSRMERLTELTEKAKSIWIDLRQGQGPSPVPGVIELTGDGVGASGVPPGPTKAAVAPPSVAIMGAEPPVNEAGPTSEKVTPREAYSSSMTSNSFKVTSSGVPRIPSGPGAFSKSIRAVPGGGASPWTVCPMVIPLTINVRKIVPTNIGLKCDRICRFR